MSLGEPPLEADATGALLDHPNAGNRAIRGSLLRSGAYVGGILATLISAPLLVRHLGIAGFGRYSLVNNTVGAFTMLVDAGLLTIAQREYVHRSGEDRKHTMAALVGLRLTLTISAVGAAIAFCAMSGYGTELVIGAVLAGTGSVVLATQHMTSTPLTVELRNGVTSAIDLCGQLANAGLVILLVVLGASLLPFLATGILLSSIALVVTKYLVRDKFPLMPRFDRRRWSELLRASLPYVAAAAITGLYFRLALIVLAQTSGDLETGEYATAFRLVEVVLGVPALLVSAAFPIIARAAYTDGERLRYQIGRIYEVALILGVWFVVGIMLIAPFALQYIAGDAGAGSVSVLRLQGPAVLATFFAVASAFPLLALRRHREVLIANVAGLVTGAVAVAILAPAAGADGTAVATVIAETVLATVMTVYLLRSHTGSKLPLATLPFVLVFAGLALLLLLVPIHPIVRAVVGTLIYFGGLALFRRLPEETLVALGVRRIFPAK